LTHLKPNMETFENKPQIGAGIYTIPDIAQILRLPNNKVSRWIRNYWDDRLGKQFDKKYSWSIDQTKAVSFHTLVELYIFHHLNEQGIDSKKVLKAHQVLSEKFNTLFPFANADVLKVLKTDGSRLYLEQDNNTIITLDKSNQLNLEFIKFFFKLVEFDDDALARRFWPLGKTNSIVCDPERQFGHPVIADTNINPEAIFSLFKAGEPVNFISHLYELSEKEVQDAIDYCMAA
jgi:uncharacterized protein (DUF433 family)